MLSVDAGGVAGCASQLFVDAKRAAATLLGLKQTPPADLPNARQEEEENRTVAMVPSTSRLPASPSTS